MHTSAVSSLWRCVPASNNKRVGGHCRNIGRAFWHLPSRLRNVSSACRCVCICVRTNRAFTLRRVFESLACLTSCERRMNGPRHSYQLLSNGRDDRQRNKSGRDEPGRRCCNSERCSPFIFALTSQAASGSRLSTRGNSVRMKFHGGREGESRLSPLISSGSHPFAEF